MVQVVLITKAKFLEMYSRNGLEDPMGPVLVGAEQRMYGRTKEEQANNPDSYIVVYCVV